MGDNRRVVSNSDILKYEPLINLMISSIILKNWTDCNYFAHPDILEIGHTGHTIEDLRQEFRIIVFKALLNYSSSYVKKGTFGGRVAKESSYVHTCVRSKALTFVRTHSRIKNGYGAICYSIDYKGHPVLAI